MTAGACAERTDGVLLACLPVLLLLMVCSKRLAKMISTMRERMSAKLGNNNDNAFKMRKLFKMYDKQDTGMVSTLYHSAQLAASCRCRAGWAGASFVLQPCLQAPQPSCRCGSRQEVAVQKAALQHSRLTTRQAI